MVDQKIRILYRPAIDKEEREIFEKVFEKSELDFYEYIIKGISAAAFDVQFIIEFLREPIVTQLLVGSVLLLIKELFDRNRARKFYKENRPKYTEVVVKLRKTYFTVSNVNKENKITIEHVSIDGKKFVIEDYSEEKLKDLLEKIKE